MQPQLSRHSSSRQAARGHTIDRLALEGLRKHPTGNAHQTLLSSSEKLAWVSTKTREDHVITTVADTYDATIPSIFILTQERFLQRDDLPKIDLLFVDEFYKLDPTRKDERFETLNIALYRAFPRAKQCFMAGPHIKGIILGDRYRGSFRFVQTDYRTVTVNVVDRSAGEDKLQAFIADLKSVGAESSIVFTATPGSAHDILNEIVLADVKFASPLGLKLSEWIAANYHKDWPVGRGTEHGIAVHHGRLPRSLGQFFIQLFDREFIKILVCTSTLIEGVNTSAANVFIYDKKINRSDFDFFSFANIRGRVGRMMRHFVGKAFLYHEPPIEVETNVEIPVLSDPSSSTDYIVMNVAPDALDADGRLRQAEMPAQSGLSEPILKEYGALGIDHLTAALGRIRELIEEDEGQLIWAGLPNKDQRIAVADVALLIAHARRDQTGLHTARQVAWGWAQLKQIKTLPGFLRWFAATFFSEDRGKGVDEAFRFLQACEFTFPRSLAAIEALVRHAQPGAEPKYGPFIVEMESWFRPSWMKQVDEAGIPLPLAERLAPYLRNPRTRREALEQLATVDLERGPFSDIDRLLIEFAADR